MVTKSRMTARPDSPRNRPMIVPTGVEWSPSGVSMMPDSAGPPAAIPAGCTSELGMTLPPGRNSTVMEAGAAVAVEAEAVAGTKTKSLRIFVPGY